MKGLVTSGELSGHWSGPVLLTAPHQERNQHYSSEPACPLSPTLHLVLATTKPPFFRCWVSVALASTRGLALRAWCTQISFYIQQKSTLIKYTLYIYSCLLIYLPNTQLLLSHIYFNCNKLFHLELWTACKIIRHIKERSVWKTALLFVFVPKWKKRRTKKTIACTTTWPKVCWHSVVAADDVDPRPAWLAWAWWRFFPRSRVFITLFVEFLFYFPLWKHYWGDHF